MTQHNVVDPVRVCLCLRAKRRGGRSGARDEGRISRVVREIDANVPGAYDTVAASRVTAGEWYQSRWPIVERSIYSSGEGGRTDRIPCLSTARLLTPRR